MLTLCIERKKEVIPSEQITTAANDDQTEKKKIENKIKKKVLEMRNNKLNAI